MKTNKKAKGIDDSRFRKWQSEKYEISQAKEERHRRHIITQSEFFLLLCVWAVVLGVPIMFVMTMVLDNIR
jgi:hypothetical protein